ncbi:MAG: hypothetical protein FWG34_12315 [Oscillospiraceae bacterium]|nr:hypothetical protein [Oscillospiraceae bacterium]
MPQKDKKFRGYDDREWLKPPYVTSFKPTKEMRDKRAEIENKKQGDNMVKKISGK